jgi:3-oxoacyl-[acyl-carrier protein] reductase
MAGSFAGRTVLVLAASQGLGRGIAEAFAAQGARLAICSRREEAIAEVAVDLHARFGVDVLARAVDVAKPGELEAFVKDAGARFGGLDVLVTNAGGPPAGDFGDVSDAAWLGAIDLVLLSVARAVRAALPFLAGRPGASILSVVSSSAKVPIPHLVLSNALRPAIVGLAKSLSLELAPQGIRVNCLAPGRIDTERVRHLDQVHAQKTGVTAEAWRQQSEASIPWGRYGTTAEFADVALFLASDAARYVTGQTLFVDGGLVKTLL